MNGDGRAEALVGASEAIRNGRDEAGSAYIVSGRAH